MASALLLPVWLSALDVYDVLYKHHDIWQTRLQPLSQEEISSALYMQMFYLKSWAHSLRLLAFR